MYWQTLFVFGCVVLSSAEEYQDSLKQLWQKDSDSVRHVTSASVVVQPTSFSSQYPREPKAPYSYRRYAFKPRAIPIRDEAQVERSNVYEDVVKNKTDILFPGNYLPIAKEKGSALEGQFHAKTIPLIRSGEYQGRSFEGDQPIIEKPEGFAETSASRRSISYILGSDGDEDDDYEEYEEEDVNPEERKKGGIKKKIKPKKLKKYMLPLLLAYKMKYFALVPVMIAGLVLLIGATGLAGFFFALFAAVMGLQKGGY